MNYQIELRHLHYFRVLAQELHFRKAAEKLFITQPGLSRQIKQLEEIYKTPLFERNNRSVSLTAAGKFLQQEVELIFTHISNLHNQIEKIAEGKITNLRLGFIGSAVQTILPELLAKIKIKEPLIDITLQELANELQLDMLVKKEIDFAFVRSEHYPAQIHSLPILTENFALVVPKGHPILKKTAISISELKDESFILFSKEYSSWYYDLVMSIFKDHHFQPKVTLRTVNALSIFNLVSQGLGIAIVPSSLKKGYNADVEFIELYDIAQRTTLHLAWHAQNTNPGKDLFIDILKDIIHKKGS